MKANEYAELAMRTNDGRCTERLEDWEKIRTGTLNRSDAIIEEAIDAGEVINACLGLSGEVGELNDMIKKWIFHMSEIDREHLKKETGDICWYIALFCHSMNFSLEEIMEKNIEKLRKRYPEGFDTAKSNNRHKDDI